MINSIVTLTTAAILLLIGRWGYRNADTLAPSLLAEEKQDQRSRVIRRGAIACYGAAAIFVVIMIIGLIS